MTRFAPVTTKLSPISRRPDLGGWRHDLFLAALTGVLSLSAFEALFDRMERQS